MLLSYITAVLTVHIANAASAVLHIRLAKEFVAAKGRDRLLSLGLFTSVADNGSGASTLSSESSRETEACNAYDFMRRRKAITGRDPALARWQASIRLGSYAASEGANLCVWDMACSCFLPQLTVEQMSSVGALLDHMIRERAVGELEDEGIGGLNVRGIEVLAL